LRKNLRSLKKSLIKINPMQQTADLEKAVIGAVLLEKSAYYDVADILTSKMFCEPPYKAIWEAIENVAKNDNPIDLLTTKRELERQGNLDKVGGHVALSQLTTHIGSTANISSWAEGIKAEYLRRWLGQFAEQIKSDANKSEEDIYSIIESSEKQLLATGQQAEGSDGVFLSESGTKVIQTLDNLEKGIIDGVHSGLKDLDHVTAGLHNSDLVIIAGRPAMGKTSAMIQFARNIASEGGMVGIFSLEMPVLQLHQKMIANQTGIDSAKFRHGSFSQDQYQLINNALADPINERIIVEDKPALSPFNLRSKGRRWAKKHGLNAIFIDYLQKMQSEGRNRDEELGHLSRSCKELAKELNIPVIAFSQLSRAVENRGGYKMPQLSDLRESGNIEQDADQVLFMWRGSYYNIPEDEDGNSTDGVLRWIAGKNRHGPAKDIPSGIDITTSRIWDLADASDNTQAAPF
jgi:replicative DNA helicase